VEEDIRIFFDRAISQVRDVLIPSQHATEKTKQSVQIETNFCHLSIGLEFEVVLKKIWGAQDTINLDHLPFHNKVLGCQTRSRHTFWQDSEKQFQDPFFLEEQGV
jgi:hypothetical protein